MMQVVYKLQLNCCLIELHVAVQGTASCSVQHVKTFLFRKLSMLYPTAPLNHLT